MKETNPSTVRWGVIGAGNVCEYKSGPPLYKLPNASLSLVYRRDRKAGTSFVERHGHGRYVDRLEDLLESDEIDAVYVATPHARHAEQTIAALRAGKPVMVEKPMAINTRECDEMVATARETALPLGVAYYRRGYPSIARLRELITDGAIGRVQTAAFNNEFPTSHRLDLVHCLFGDITQARTLPGNNDPYSFESTIDRFEVRTEGDVVVRMMTGWSESGMPEAIRVDGESGTLHLHDLKGGRLSLVRNRTTEELDCGTLPYTHWGLFDNFNRHLLEGVPLLCDGVEGRKSTVILDCLQAIRTPREWVEVDYQGY
ncbi:MAG: Gfo/Idh/MocA family protein [Oceanipulchritudo sp.]